MKRILSILASLLVAFVGIGLLISLYPISAHEQAQQRHVMAGQLVQEVKKIKGDHQSVIDSTAIGHYGKAFSMKLVGRNSTAIGIAQDSDMPEGVIAWRGLYAPDSSVAFYDATFESTPLREQYGETLESTMAWTTIDMANTLEENNGIVTLYRERMWSHKKRQSHYTVRGITVGGRTLVLAFCESEGVAVLLERSKGQSETVRFAKLSEHRAVKLHNAEAAQPINSDF